MPFDQGEQLCRDKGVTMPVMESYKYAADIAQFLGTRVNGNQGETSFWLGKEKFHFNVSMEDTPALNCKCCP